MFFPDWWIHQSEAAGTFCTSEWVCRSDIEWCYRFAETWNGIPMLPSLNCKTPLAVNTLIGGNVEQLVALEQLSHIYIKEQELTPNVIVVAMWGKRWPGQLLLVQLDNIATVTMVNSRISDAMHLLRCLSFKVAKFQLSFTVVDILGEKNTIADVFSYPPCPQVCHNMLWLHQ